MKKIAIVVAVCIALGLLVVGLGALWYVHTKLPVRSGNVTLQHLTSAVTVQYDERGIPHIEAGNQADLYRALGYVHAQDRLFQMELVRRAANGELAEVLGPALLDSDKLFRTLGLREHAKATLANLDMNSPVGQAITAYLDGVNQFQATHPAPMEFDLIGIPKRPFAAEDVLAVTGYLAYTFAPAFQNAPLMTFIRDKLGPQYLSVFDVDGHPEGGLQSLASAAPGRKSHPALALGPDDWNHLNQLASISRGALQAAGMGAFQGSNAWVISGKRTVSGKPILAGDPHIGFSIPAVWYEAHLHAPDFELYGQFQALNPLALLGHNTEFGWSLTMLENDDMDLIAEKTNPANPNQVWSQDQWVDLQTRSETIKVKGQPSVTLSLRHGPHGPIVTDVVKNNPGSTPIAMWWAYLETENPILQAFYELNRANTLDKAREAAKKIHAPGLNVLWASASGDIAWWGAAKLPQRPEGVNPLFILDAAKGEAEKPGYYNFSFNPQEENPARGYIVSANQQPGGVVPVFGHYPVPDRAKRLDDALQDIKPKWASDRAALLQLDNCSGYPKRVLSALLPVMEQVISDPNQRAFMEPLQKWDGCYDGTSVAATLFTQFRYDLAKAIFEDELGEARFQSLLGSEAGSTLLDHALPLLMADAKSPWWDNVKSPAKESRFETVRVAWTNTLKHLEGLYGTNLVEWSWGRTHTITHIHPMGTQEPFGWLFNVGPFAVLGGQEAPNNLTNRAGPGPWTVTYGPSTRRVIDFGALDKSLVINPLGQSGVPFDSHYADQAERFTQGGYMHQHLSAADVKSHAKETLTLAPAH
ncbi:penicillin acylase family protein [Rhodoferax sp. GW822-FHT02A01]|uniref:penicillin acylase family protein n=1 Tax=Rhodoferax sp. GW822-FHT02A01 TaxID=3141537 RepID=UPI00315DE932